MTRFMTANVRNPQMSNAVRYAEASCPCAYSVNNNTAMIAMGASLLVPISVILASIMRLYHMNLAYSVSILISIIYLLRTLTAPKETSDL